MENTLSHAGTVDVVKNFSYFATAVATVKWIGISQMSVEILAVFIILDLITGTLAAGYINGWSTIRSSTFERGLIGKLLLVSVPFIVALTGKSIGVDMVVLAASALNILVVSEAYSIIGNINAMRTGSAKNEFDAVSFLLRHIQMVLKNFLPED